MTFPCGHERTPENTTRAGMTRRCKRCQSEAMARARAKRKQPPGRYADKNGAPIAEPVNSEAMRLANQDFMRAMWKHHKRIMMVAQACGRQVVQP